MISFNQLRTNLQESDQKLPNVGLTYGKPTPPKNFKKCVTKANITPKTGKPYQLELWQITGGKFRWKGGKDVHGWDFTAPIFKTQKEAIESLQHEFKQMKLGVEIEEGLEAKPRYAVGKCLVKADITPKTGEPYQLELWKETHKGYANSVEFKWTGKEPNVLGRKLRIWVNFTAKTFETQEEAIKSLQSTFKSSTDKLKTLSLRYPTSTKGTNLPEGLGDTVKAAVGKFLGTGGKPVTTNNAKPAADPNKAGVHKSPQAGVNQNLNKAGTFKTAAQQKKDQETKAGQALTHKTFSQMQKERGMQPAMAEASEAAVKVRTPSNVDSFDASGYDQKEGMKMAPPKSHAHYKEAIDLGWKPAGSYHSFYDGNASMHHVMTNPEHPGHQLHLVSSLSTRSKTHSYNPHGREVNIQTKSVGPEQKPTAIALYPPGSRKSVYQFMLNVKKEPLAKKLADGGIKESIKEGSEGPAYDANIQKGLKLCKEKGMKYLLVDTRNGKPVTGTQKKSEVEKAVKAFMNDMDRPFTIIDVTTGKPVAKYDAGGIFHKLNKIWTA